MNIPEENWKAGWPELLKDNNGRWYVRLRDGKETSHMMGDSVLYGRLTEDGFIEDDYQYIPVLGATEDDMAFTAGPWMEGVELEKIGQTPIVVPDEPVDIPEENS